MRLPGRNLVVRSIGVPALALGVTAASAGISAGMAAAAAPGGDAPVLRWLPPVPAASPTGPAGPATGPPALRRDPAVGPDRPRPPARAGGAGLAGSGAGRAEAPRAGADRSATMARLAQSSAAMPGPGRGGEATPATYTLVPGDHLWKVAEQTMARVLGHPPAPEALAQYWWRLVERNRPDLPDPANPDFVVPGLTVVLPPVVP